MIACSKEENVEVFDSANSVNEKNVRLKSHFAEGSSTIYHDYFNHFLSDDLGLLEETPYHFEDGDDEIQIFETALKHSDNSDIPKARFIIAELDNGNVYTEIHDYSNVNIGENGVPLSGFISIKLVNGLELSRIEKNEFGKWVYKPGADLDLIPNSPTQGIEGWWQCTADCYSYARTACGTDPDCQLLCDLADIVGLCTISIATSCGIHCARNSGTFNPPIQISLLSSLEPYGFY